MQYKDALKVQKGDLLCLKYSNYRMTQVLAIEHNRRYHMITFHCTDGEYAHKEVILPISNEELAQKYIKDPHTRVYVKRNHELGEWLYSAVVEESNEFCLASFKTYEEAEQYIVENQLKKFNRGGSSK